MPRAAARKRIRRRRDAGPGIIFLCLLALVAGAVLFAVDLVAPGALRHALTAQERAPDAPGSPVDDSLAAATGGATDRVTDGDGAAAVEDAGDDGPAGAGEAAPAPPRAASLRDPRRPQPGGRAEAFGLRDVPDATRATMTAPLEIEPEPARLRQISGPGITLGPQVAGPLKREPTPVVPPRQEEPESEPYRLVVVLEADRIDLRSQVVRLAHVDAPGILDTCARPDGAGTWPCGRRARTEMRRLIRRRAVRCDPVDGETLAPPAIRTAELAGPEAIPRPQAARLDRPADRPRGTRAARCAVGKTDLSRWLVAQGWARPEPDAPESFHALHEEARAAGVGLFAPDPR